MLKQGWYNKEITCNKYFPICSTVVICRVGCELMIGFKISIFLILTPALSRTLTFFLFLDLFNFFNFFNFNHENNNNNNNNEKLNLTFQFEKQIFA